MKRIWKNIGLFVVSLINNARAIFAKKTCNSLTISYLPPPIIFLIGVIEKFRTERLQAKRIATLRIENSKNRNSFIFCKGLASSEKE
jgi:hypothetical protein